MESAAKAPFKAAGRLSRDGGDGACVERAAGRLQQSRHLLRRPLPSARRWDAALLQRVVYGFLKSDIVILIANAVSLALLLGILYFKFRERASPA